MVAAFAASGMPVRAVEELLLKQTRKNFWDPDPIGAVMDARRGHGFTGLLKGERFRRLLEEHLPVRTFEELPHPLLLVAANLTRARTTCSPRASWRRASTPRAPTRACSARCRSTATTTGTAGWWTRRPRWR